MVRTRRRRKRRSRRRRSRRRRKRQCGDCRPRGHQVYNSLHLTLGWATSCPVLCSRAAFMASRGPIRFITHPGAENNILGRSLFLGSREGWDSGGFGRLPGSYYVYFPGTVTRFGWSGPPRQRRSKSCERSSLSRVGALRGDQREADKGYPGKTIGRKVPEGLRAATTSTDPHSSGTLGIPRHSSVSLHGGRAYVSTADVAGEK
ncbi:hypothetical protein E2C01_083680 [Portunus trituberculatus]|uniref:Uncharacterized protein n=1 Tax=Portunus trituberculatus TaxID=210409 RepID=A0A5B7IVS9_PORTR|nr:hypothetical protein [Portunus trituberculatus]